MSISFENASHSDRDSILSFIAANYDDHYVFLRQPSLFEWQYRSDTGYDFVLARDDNRSIIAILGAMPTTFGIGGKELQVSWACNWMVDDTYRHSGLGAYILREAMSQFDGMATTGLKPGDATNVMVALDWEWLDYMPRYFAVLDAGRFKSIAACENLPLLEAAEKPSDDLNACTAPPEDIGDLWTSFIGDGAGVIRSKSYLERRYSRHPVFEYRMICVSKSNQTRGFAVYRIEVPRDVPDAPIGRIVEFFAERAHQEELLESVIIDSASRGCCALDFFCTFEGFRNALEGRGFFDLSQDGAPFVPSLFQPISTSKSGINAAIYPSHLLHQFDRAKLYITKGDNDQDRPN